MFDNIRKLLKDKFGKKEIKIIALTDENTAALRNLLREVMQKPSMGKVTIPLKVKKDASFKDKKIGFSFVKDEILYTIESTVSRPYSSYNEWRYDSFYLRKETHYPFETFEKEIFIDNHIKRCFNINNDFLQDAFFAVTKNDAKEEIEKDNQEIKI